MPEQRKGTRTSLGRVRHQCPPEVPEWPTTIALADSLVRVYALRLTKGVWEYAVSPRAIALFLLSAVAMSGCTIAPKLVRRTCQVTVESYDRLGVGSSVLVDPGLATTTNEQRPGSGLFGTKIDQRIEIRHQGPLMLVPATPEDVERIRIGQRPARSAAVAVAVDTDSYPPLPSPSAPPDSATPPTAYPESLRR